MLTRTNCINKVHSLKFSMVDSSLILDFSLQEVARRCSGLERRCTHCFMGIVSTGAGATHMRAVGVDEPAAGGTWIWAGQGLLRQRARLSALASKNHASQRELYPSSGAGARPGRCQADMRPPRAQGRRQHLPGLQTPICPAE